MIKEQAFAKIRFDKETKIINRFFHCNENWDNNNDYQAMIKEGNFFEASEQEYFLCVSGKEFCYIDGKIQEYIEHLEVKLESSKTLKKSELKKVYANDDTWKFTIIYEPVQTPALLPLVLQNNIIGKFATTIQFKDKGGAKKIISISNTKAIGVLNDNTKIALALKDTKEAIELKISNAKTIEAIQAIDIQKEFSSIEKVITIK
jgi:hypothetical protein